MKFETYQHGREWRWRLKASNGETIASGEGYSRKEDCLNAVSLVKSSASAPVEEVSD